MTHDAGSHRDTPLTLKLKERIRRDGPIPVDAFMRACLTDPEHGYYVRQPAIGREGDFITAPEISQVFGELIGLWSAVVWLQMGSPGRVSLVELGPGRGTLMADAVRAARLVSPFRDALSLHLVEVSEPLRARQRAALAGSGVEATWHADVKSLPPGPAIVIANEFLDALPVSQVVLERGAWRERVVTLGAGDALVFGAGEAAHVPPPPQIASKAASGSVFERARGVADLIEATARSRTDADFAFLIIDYGHARSALGDTLQAVWRHTHVSPLELCGEADLTAQVDFEAVAGAAERAGVAVDGPITHAEFLGRLGIVERASRLMSANPGQAAAIEAAVARLMAPNGMGARFKAMGLRSPGLRPLPGFA